MEKLLVSYNFRYYTLGMKQKSNIEFGEPSKKQTEVLSFIEEYRNNEGHSPSLEEIAKHFNRSITTIHQHVAALKKKNLLSTEKGKRRSISTFDKKNATEAIQVPLMGIIAAGSPIEAIRDPRPIDVPKNMVSAGSKHYALRIAGDSMIEDGICDGDIVVLKAQSTAADGDKVVAYLPDENEVTLKRFYRDDGKIKLVPANKKLKSFYVKNIEVQGKVTGVIRRET